MKRAYPFEKAATGAFYATFLIIGDEIRNRRIELKKQ